MYLVLNAIKCTVWWQIEWPNIRVAKNQES